MVHCLVLAAISLLGACRAGGAGDAELGDLVTELRELAQRQQEKIDAYEVIVQKELAAAPARQRQLQSVLNPSIFGFGAGTRPYSLTAEKMLLFTHVWLLLCGALAMFMQAGFAMIEAGQGRVKNAQTVLLKNLTMVTASCLGWWTLGWSFAYSGPFDVNGYKENKFAGKEQFMGHHFLLVRPDGQQEPSDRMVRWFFSWAVCSAATVIASAGVAERINFLGSLIFSFLFSSFIYPIVVAWTWGKGWLSDMNDTGFMDLAGSGIVFMSGGVAALVGALIAGRRKGRFDGLTGKERTQDWPRSFQPHSMPLVVMGTFIVWFGSYGLFCGAVMSMAEVEQGMLAAQVAMNMTIAAAGGGMIVFLLRTATCRKYDIGMFCNGIIAGLVSIAAGASTVEYGSAVAIGIVGGILYFATALGIRGAKIDDPIDTFATYGVPGMWGVVAASLFDWGHGFGYVHGRKGFKCILDTNGICKGKLDGLGKDLVAANFALIGATLGWVAVLSAIVFAVLKAAKLLKEQEDPAPQRPDEAAGEERIDYRYEDVYANSSI